MILRFLVLVGLIAFCVWQLFAQLSSPGPVYLPLVYIAVPILLVVGMGPRGVFTWPIAGILLLLQGHWIIGFVPPILVLFTVIGNEWLNKRYGPPSPPPGAPDAGCP